MKVSNVKIQSNQTVMKTLTDAAGRAMELTAQAILSDLISRQVIPKDTSELERSHFVEKTNDLVYHIVSSSKYARRWYFNLPIDDKLGRHYEPAVFQKTKNPNAQDHWMDYYLNDEGMEFIIDTFADFWKKESRGIIK
jgi:hypothetical protein